MKGKKNREFNSINRRSFVANTAKIVALGTLLLPLAEACNNKKSSTPSTKDNGTKKPSQPSSKKKRKSWTHESLVMNSKTGVLHFPTSKLYRYYDEIKTSHLQNISLATWATQFQEPVKLHKQQSGNILEILTMQHLRQGVNDQSLTSATNTLAKAFTTSCENAKGFNFNSNNFRLHELMLQLIALNSGIAATDKWTTFNSKVKRPETLRKRQKWMEAEPSFTERVNYILNRQNDYITRLTQRAAKYSFS